MDDKGRIMAGAVEKVDTGCACQILLILPKQCVSYTSGDVFQLK